MLETLACLKNILQICTLSCSHYKIQITAFQQRSILPQLLHFNNYDLWKKKNKLLCNNFKINNLEIFLWYHTAEKKLYLVKIIHTLTVLWWNSVMLYFPQICIISHCCQCWNNNIENLKRLLSKLQTRKVTLLKLSWYDFRSDASGTTSWPSYY